MPDAGYWDVRATRYGHTGWSDWVIYPFDQCARLAAMRAVTGVLVPGRNGRALDYGSGTGDFALMLSKRYQHVMGIDISSKVLEIARKRYARRRNITFLHADAELGLSAAPVDFVLTVTVLNHIMDDSSLRATIEHLTGILAPGGCFVALESCTAVKSETRSNYQRNHTHDEWKAMFERCGLVLEDCFGFYHPTADRCQTFDRYARSLPVRLLRRIGHTPVTARALGAVAALYLLGRRDYFWRAKPTDALRLMIFRKPAASRLHSAPVREGAAMPAEAMQTPCACARTQELTDARPACEASRSPATDRAATRPPGFF